LRLRFDGWVLDLGTRELLRDRTPVPLSPKAFQFLQVLLERRPKAVSQEEIHELVWPGTFVSPSSLTRIVAEVRSALGDDAQQPRLLRTVHRFGYAFCGEASEERPARRSRWRPAGCRVALGSQVIPLAEGENILGRDDDAVVWVDSRGVSRRHAVIRVQGGQAVIEDLGSKNGTSVGGKRIKQPMELGDGDVIALGSTFLTFYSGAPASTRTEGLDPEESGP
jgi:DNA-binding winged helix-turn-helix (wHTH) protein